MQAATGGADAETDDALRQRILDNRKSAENSTPNGIQTAIKNLNGVTDVRLVNNNTMSKDNYGNPPKSVHLYVIGGNDSQISQKFFDVLPPQTKTIGSVIGMATDVGGRQYAVSFDRAKTVPIYVELDLNVKSTVFDTDNGPKIIKTNILNYFDTLNMGDKVLYSKLFGPGYSPAGVTDVAVKLGTDPKALAETDISISDFQLAVLSSDNITINVIEN